MEPSPPDRGRLSDPRQEFDNSPKGGLNGRNSYADVARKKFPALTLDLCCNLEGERASSQVVADFVFNDLKIIPGEISRIVGIGKPTNVVSIITKSEVLINERFGDNVEFHRQYGNLRWNCSIRGGVNRSFIRLFHVPHDLEDEDLLQPIKAFATPLSGLMIEKFGKDCDPRFFGIGSGHMRVRVWVFGGDPCISANQKMEDQDLA